jgi:hypothetical protein
MTSDVAGAAGNSGRGPPKTRWRLALHGTAVAALVMGPAIAVAGCTAAYLQNAARWSAVVESGTLRVYGGPGDSTYLGCLNCLESDTESVLNLQGPYGSHHSATSISNPSGSFGSPGSPFSACNPFATDPPIIVDDQGYDYGWLTLDPSRAMDPSADAVQRWIDRLCAPRPESG